MPAWLRYSLLRLLMLAVPLAILLALRVNVFIAAIAASIIALCLSYVLLVRQRSAFSRQVYEAKRAEHGDAVTDDDTEAEDAVLDHGGSDQRRDDDAERHEG